MFVRLFVCLVGWFQIIFFYVREKKDEGKDPKKGKGTVAAVAVSWQLSVNGFESTGFTISVINMYGTNSQDRAQRDVYIQVYSYRYLFVADYRDRDPLK